MDFAISFDFWNTLFADGMEPDRRQLRIDYFYNLVSKKSDISRKDTETAFDVSSDYFLNEWRNKFRTPATAERIIIMADYLKVELDKNEIENCRKYFAEIIKEIPPLEIPWVKNIIPQLSGKFKLGIISDTGYISGQYIREFLQENDLVKYFDSVLFSDEQGYSKPHRQMFLKTAQNLGTIPQKLIHIGDLERTDIEGAKASGCKAILFTGASGKNGHPTSADFVMNDYKELEQILSRIWA